MALPFLPGMSFNDPKKTTFARTQSLNYRNGVPVHDGRARPAKEAYSAAPPPPAWKTASGEVPPPWLAYEKKVLKFDAYFMESIPYSREPYRVRKCTIMYHLEDGTLSVTEAKVQNSGLPQGILVRRHRATKDDGTMLSYQDINTCMDLTIHGVKYRIYETTDPYTLQFMEEMGYPVNGFEDCPGDPHTEQREAMHRSMRPVRPPKSGKDPLRQFLDHDGKVLRFYCLMDDPRNRHERRTFMLQFFLADDTLSVVENLPPNCGRDASPVFAKRQAPPKGFPSLEEIRIGQMLNIFNHKFMIYDVDKFTREYYRENYGEEDFIPIDVAITYQDVPQMDIPKYNGFGTEADSLNTCLSLVPKPIKRDIQKSIENDKKILRFGAKLNSNKPVDATRTFVISYYLADDTISVYEPPQRNTGIVGGKFLERRRVKRPLKPPTLAPPLPPSSPARPHTSPNQTSFFQTTDFSLSRPSSTQQPTRSSRASTPSPTSSPTLTRSASPFSVTNRAFGYATTSGLYGHNPRTQDFLATQPRADTPPSLPGTPPRSPSRTPPSTPPARTPPSTPPARLTPTQQRREMNSRTQTTSLSTLARSLREESKPRTAATHEELESEYYTASDFYVGGLIQIFHHVFVLQDADEFALKHMEAHPDEFPVSDINRIMSRVRDEMETKWEVTSEWLRELDPARTGYIPRDSFKELVHSICPDLVDQEVLTVCRRYDLDGKGQISYEEFYTAVAPRDDF